MTPLGLRRALMLAFPEFQDCIVQRPAPYHLRLYAKVRDLRADEERLNDWIRRHKPMTAKLEVEQVVALPCLVDHDGERLRLTPLRYDHVEDASITGPGILEELHRRWPAARASVTSGANCSVIVQVHPNTPPQERNEIVAALRVLLNVDPYSIEIVERVPVGPRKASALSEKARVADEQAHALLSDKVGQILAGGTTEFDALRRGASTYADPVDGITSLVHRLSLFDTVYVPIPRPRSVEAKNLIGPARDEFLMALESPRIVPVFESALTDYEPSLVDQIVNGRSPRIIFAAEARLRRIEAVVRQHVLITRIASFDDDLRRLHAYVLKSTDDKVKLLAKYLDRLSEFVLTARVVARRETAFGIGFVPLCRFMDDIIHAFKPDAPDREIEIMGGIFNRYSCDAFSASPMCKSGHFLEPYLNLAYGVRPDASVSTPVTFNDPMAIAEVLLVSDRIPLKEFAETFEGTAVVRMRELMTSPRWWEADSVEEVVRDFEQELRHFSGTRELDEVACLAGVTASKFLTGGVSVFASFALSLARPLLERITPSWVDRVDATLTSSTKEGVLLAKVRRKLT